jgi:hypothetical protein
MKTNPVRNVPKNRGIAALKKNQKKILYVVNSVTITEPRKEMNIVRSPRPRNLRQSLNYGN